MRILTGVFAATVISTAALADDATRNPEERSMTGAQAKFESLDRNNDRQLSRSEADEDGALAAQFASVDADGDGSIEESEYLSHAEVTWDGRERSIADPFDPTNPVQ